MPKTRPILKPDLVSSLAFLFDIFDRNFLYHQQFDIYLDFENSSLNLTLLASPLQEEENISATEVSSSCPVCALGYGQKPTGIWNIEIAKY